MNTTCISGRKFWLVLNTKRKEAPVRKHWTFDAALTEAQRLASMQPQDEFVILGAETVVFMPSKVYVLQLETSEQMSVRLTTPQKSLDEEPLISEPEDNYYPQDDGELEER